jgi:hypothetical protein
MNRRVRVNNLYRFEPVLLDRIDARTNLKSGAIVRVVNLPGCPKANTMGHAHIADPDGNFIGLVCTNSLVPVISRSHRLRAVNIARAILDSVDAGCCGLVAAKDAMEAIVVCPESVRVVEVA